jgi:uncharacterized protein
MAEYLHPGVYIEEVPRGPRPIEGVPTSTAGFLLAAERGPLHPTRITGDSEYSRWFGGFDHSVRGFFENGGKCLVVCRVVSSSARTSQAEIGDFVLAAMGPGAWGQRLWIKITPSSTRDGKDIPVGFRLRVALFAPGDTPHDCFGGPALTPKPALVEDHDDLVTEPRSIDHFAKRLGADSALVTLRAGSESATTPPPAFNGTLADGCDGAPVEAADYAPVLAALEQEREVALVYSPAADEPTQRLLVEHCEKVKFRFAVLDAPRGVAPTTLEPRRHIADSACAAYYAPWLEIQDSGKSHWVPPGGHVLGIYARTDLERGVHQAPANAAVRGASGLEFSITDRDQEILTPRGVNAIRAFDGRGIRAWGARTLASQAEWKYVNVRRQLIYLEHSIDQGTQWVVFEPNGEPLWAQLRTSVEQFLFAQWRSGAFLGAKPEEAFFVRCDRTTMTQNDIDTGQLICLVGFAPLKPAEFVVLRIGHRLQSS